MVKVKSFEDNSTETEGKATIYLMYVLVLQLPQRADLESVLRSSRQISPELVTTNSDQSKETLLARGIAQYTRQTQKQPLSRLTQKGSSEIEDPLITFEKVKHRLLHL